MACEDEVLWVCERGNSLTDAVSWKGNQQYFG